MANQSRKYQSWAGPDCVLILDQRQYSSRITKKSSFLNGYLISHVHVTFGFDIQYKCGRNLTSWKPSWMNLSLLPLRRPYSFLLAKNSASRSIRAFHQIHIVVHQDFTSWLRCPLANLPPKSKKPRDMCYTMFVSRLIGSIITHPRLFKELTPNS